MGNHINKSKAAISQDELRSVLDYNPETGFFVWKISTGRRIKVGDRAGSYNTSIKYRVIGVFACRYYEHRLAWLWMTGEFPSMDIDHLNCDKSDNRWINLRQATMAQNIANIAKWRHGSSGLKGAHRHSASGGWTSSIGGKYIGYFKTKEDAHAAYSDAAHKKFKEFARTK